MTWGFFMQLPAEVIEQRHRDIRDQVVGVRRPAADRPRAEWPAVRAVGRMRRLIAAAGCGR